MLFLNLGGGIGIQILVVTDIYHIYWTAKVEGEIAPAPQHYSLKVYGRVKVNLYASVTLMAVSDHLQT